ncbi:hypothetical protein BD626DRAFT_541747 [Schizophyllum amplum]|uniref:Uncharacterized protein n=1 Tax=Schizophyllum amplum TaxID=97359 RepID=A0A550BTM3_9AGAR|nr:hypothetical protein BD626DRAFT_541747 [Auriculariopsis ampla]
MSSVSPSPPRSARSLYFLCSALVARGPIPKATPFNIDEHIYLELASARPLNLTHATATLQGAHAPCHHKTRTPEHPRLAGLSGRHLDDVSEANQDAKQSRLGIFAREYLGDDRGWGCVDDDFGSIGRFRSAAAPSGAAHGEKYIALPSTYRPPSPPADRYRRTWSCRLPATADTHEGVGTQQTLDSSTGDFNLRGTLDSSHHLPQSSVKSASDSSLKSAFGPLLGVVRHAAAIVARRFRRQISCKPKDKGGLETFTTAISRSPVAARSAAMLFISHSNAFVSSTPLTASSRFKTDLAAAAGFRRFRGIRAVVRNLIRWSIIHIYFIRLFQCYGLLSRPDFSFHKAGPHCGKPRCCAFFRARVYLACPRTHIHAPLHATAVTRRHHAPDHGASYMHRSRYQRNLIEHTPECAGGAAWRPDRAHGGEAPPDGPRKLITRILLCQQSRIRRWRTPLRQAMHTYIPPSCDPCPSGTSVACSGTPIACLVAPGRHMEARGARGGRAP